MTDMDTIYYYDSFNKLSDYCRSSDYMGYDPYDSLNSTKIKNINNRLLKIAITQFMVYSPINLRSFLKTDISRNPKAIALILDGYYNILKSSLPCDPSIHKNCELLSQYLLDSYTPGYSGKCWGFNFEWQDISRASPKGLPTIVITSFVGGALLNQYELTKEKRFLDAAKSASEFILKDLNVYESEEGICFSYTPIDNHVVHNANLLGAAFLSKLYSVGGDTNLRTHAQKALNFSLHHQERDGSWAYSMNPQTGKKRYQIDFHQGFILDSIFDIVTNCHVDFNRYQEKSSRGLNYYKNNQFHKNGRSKWRLPLDWPIDIHHQAQGISTFSKYSVLDQQCLSFAKMIASWTIENMQNDDGYFYYQKYPMMINKIPYLRWCQAWMINALSYLLLRLNLTESGR